MQLNAVGNENIKSFRRVIQLVFQHPAALTGAVVFSLLVGLMWGGNIGAVYPLFEVSFRGKSLNGWVDEEILATQKKSAELHEQIRALEQESLDAEAGRKSEIASEIQTKEQRLQAEQRALARAKWWKPYVQRYLPDDAFSTVLVVIGFLLLTTVGKNLCLVADLLFTSRLIERVKFVLRDRFFGHTLEMDMTTFGEKGTARLMTQLNNEVDAIGGGLNQLFGGAIREPFKMIACGIGAALISWRLMLLTFILTPVAVLSSRWLARRIRREFSGSLDMGAHINQVAYETFNGLETVQAFTMENSERNNYRLACKSLMQRTLKIVFYRSLAKPVAELLSIASMGMVVASGAYLVLNQETHLLGIQMSQRPLSLAALLTFYGLLCGFADPAKRLAEVFAGIQTGMAASRRFFAVLDRPTSISEPSEPQPLPLPIRRIVFEHVSFSYAKGKQVLHDISLEVKAGERLAIVGANGCGKTTLAKLMTRMYDPVQGSISFDTVDIRNVSLQQLRRRVAIVSQRINLFNASVMANIRYGSPDATDQQIIEAAQQARAHSFIQDKLANGYDTIVGQDGTRLSGGQRQRIALARAILRDPEILILDEATSHIDIESEQLIHQALQRFMQGRTAILISHRLSTLALANRICVMDSGRIIDVGTHSELMRRCDLYRRLCQSNLADAA